MIFGLLVDDSGTGYRHVECRRCGRNLRYERDACPDCGGDVSIYEIR